MYSKLKDYGMADKLSGRSETKLPCRPFLSSVVYCC